MKKKFTDNVGRVILTSDGLTELLLKGKTINGFLAEECEETIKYNRFAEDSSLTLYTDSLKNQTKNEYDDVNTEIWFTPEEYQNINIKDWLISRCSTQIQKDRVLEELNMYEERNLYPLLKHLIFLIEHFRKNDIIWGVGRGSSVASYCLFLIGVHRVDSIRYQLDIKEFLK